MKTDLSHTAHLSSGWGAQAEEKAINLDLDPVGRRDADGRRQDHSHETAGEAHTVACFLPVHVTHLSTLKASQAILFVFHLTSC